MLNKDGNIIISSDRRWDCMSTIIDGTIGEMFFFNSTLKGCGIIVIDNKFINEMFEVSITDSLVELLIDIKINDYFYSN